jgi:hypothetical protein
MSSTPTEREDFSMQTLMKTSIYPALVAMFVTLALVGPAAAQKGVPFQGTIQGDETGVVTFPTLSVDGSGTGIATHLGRYTVTWEATVNLVDGSAIPGGP